MKIENTIKIRFTILVLILIMTVLLGSIYYDKSKEINFWEKSIHLGSQLRYNVYFDVETLNYANNHESCVYNNENKSIVLRIDDIAGWRSKRMMEIFVNEMLNRDMDTILGVIPENLGNSHEVSGWLREIREDDRVEIVLHGYDHVGEEFKNLSEDEASERIEKGKTELLEAIGIVPISFIPPYNEYSDGTVMALEKSEFRIFSAGKNDINLERDMYFLGYTARTYDFDNAKFIPVEEVIADCKNSLEYRNICVIMIHPQDYLIHNTNDFDGEKFSEYERLLDELLLLDVEFKTYEDLLSCDN
jgi:peptidoglycan/xylan/chitin deacetylase (PgdA/CDA1 family)